MTVAEPVMVDLEMVWLGMEMATRAEGWEALRSDLLALGLQWAVVELLIAGEIVRRSNR